MLGPCRSWALKVPQNAFYNNAPMYQDSRNGPAAVAVSVEPRFAYRRRSNLLALHFDCISFPEDTQKHCACNTLVNLRDGPIANRRPFAVPVPLTNASVSTVCVVRIVSGTYLIASLGRRHFQFHSSCLGHFLGGLCIFDLHLVGAFRCRVCHLS